MLTVFEVIRFCVRVFRYFITGQCLPCLFFKLFVRSTCFNYLINSNSNWVFSCIWLHPATNPIFYAFLGQQVIPLFSYCRFNYIFQFKGRLRKVIPCLETLRPAFSTSHGTIADPITTKTGYESGCQLIPSIPASPAIVSSRNTLRVQNSYE